MDNQPEEAAKEAAKNGGPFSISTQNYEYFFNLGVEWQASNPKPEQGMKWDDIKNCKIKGVVPVRVKSTISGTITYGTGLFSNEGFEMATFLNKTIINKNEPDVIIQFLDESIPSHKETNEGEKIEVLENGNKAYKAGQASNPKQEEKETFTLEQMIVMCSWLFDGDYIHTLTNSHDLNNEIIRLVNHYSKFPQFINQSKEDIDYIKKKIKDIPSKQEHGMKWVNCSKQMPTYWGVKIARFIHTKTPLLDPTSWLNSHKNESYLIEWLDESIQ